MISLSNLLGVQTFKFPYEDFDFEGKHSQEKVLFVTRESEKILAFRLLVVFLIIATFFFSGLYALNIIKVNLFVPNNSIMELTLYWLIINLTLLLVGWWWFFTLWKNSLFIITNRRLTKIIYTSPWNKYHLSLNLDKIVDGGAYRKGFLQTILGLGYFVARSSAGNIKNFKIINIDFAEDLHNYVTKLLYTFNNQTEKLDNFRPFIPYLKGKERRRLAPQYYQES